MMANSFGRSGESLDQAIERIEPLLKVALLKKLLGAMNVTRQELAEAGLDASVYLQGQPEAIVAVPNQSKRTVKAGEILEIQFQHQTKQALSCLMIVISPTGSILLKHYPEGKIAQLLELNSAQGGGNKGEILVLISAKPLDGVNAQLVELLQELQPPEQRVIKPSRSRRSNPVNAILNDLSQTPRARGSKAISQLVISLPIHIV
jgi:hypothetical protein